MEVNSSILNYRREQCTRCPTPCQFQNDTTFLTEGDNECPEGRWMKYQLFKRNKFKGAGDVVASFAEPIAGAIDAAFGTKVKKCSACAKRREMLNQLIPFGK